MLIVQFSGTIREILQKLADLMREVGSDATLGVLTKEVKLNGY